MKFRIRNEFSEESTKSGPYSVRPFDYHKFKDERIVELNTVEELYEFMYDAERSINYVKDHFPHDWIAKYISVNRKTHELEIRIHSVSAD